MMLEPRFKVIPGSDSGHCCFEATVVDTSRPVIVRGKPWVFDGEPQYETVCETFDMAAAEQIAAALNGAVAEPATQE
jgi:hypothetical protein